MQEEHGASVRQGLSRRGFLAGAAGAGLALTLPGTARAQSGQATESAGSCGVVLRTPEESFDNLPDYPFEPNYVTVNPCGLRMHYLDEGPQDGELVLLMHGNPAWSYMYREWIPILVEQGYRVIAPDLIGFGKSDKLEYEQYTYERQIQWMTDFVNKLGLSDINLYCQDWGGLIFLRIVADKPELFARVVASNTALPDGRREPTPAFLEWLVISQLTPQFGPIIELGTVGELTAEEEAAYDVPWPTEELKKGPRAMVLQVPLFDFEFLPDDQARANKKALKKLESFNKPFLTLWAEEDTITTGWDEDFKNLVPGAEGLPHKTFNASHFIQETYPEELSNEMINLIENF